MKKYTVKDILKIQVAPALGCTEPVAIALATAAAVSVLPKKQIDQIEVWVDPNIYKNGLSVFIPGTDGLSGLDTAAALGAMGGDPSRRMEVLEPIFEFALSLDPYNTRARDYLGRIKARINVFAGNIGPEMGKSPTNPIEVDNPYQEYEYIRLFKASPIICTNDPNASMDACECENEKGEIITYYFRSKSAQKWAF